MQFKRQSGPLKRRWLHIVGNTVFIALFICMLFFASLLVGTKHIISSLLSRPTTEISTAGSESLIFPVSVNPLKKEIVENPAVDAYFEEHVLPDTLAFRGNDSWFGKALGALALQGWFQNLASPSSRMLIIQPGERKEQVAQNFSDILRWSRAERTAFMTAVTEADPTLEDGKFFPGTYVVARGAKPDAVSPLVAERFTEEVLSRYTDDVAETVPLEDALTIASLLEREAYDFEDMRQISGVIWNRLFIDMNLQIDASLQYAKGSRTDQPWWPRVLPSDKYIKSPYNTYQNKGLPPAPIANPSLDAILAALNPRKTDCLFYFHDKKGGFHCAPTYEEHVALLKEYYGRGK